MSLDRRNRQAEREAAARLVELSGGMLKLHKALVRLHKLLPHPAWGLMLGAAVSFVGRGDLALRSYALLFIALWLAVDLWAWLLTKPDPRRLNYCLGWTATSGMLIVVMWTMWWWLDGKLQDQRDDVHQHLTATHQLRPGEEDDPMHTAFSVSNDSASVISRRHGITCLTNLSVGNDETSSSRSVVSWVWPNGTIGYSGSVHTFDLPSASSPLLPGGDAQTDPCLQGWAFVHGTACADITLIFWYSLEDQPDSQQEKRFRFVATKGKTGQFQWSPQPVQSPQLYCASYFKVPVRRRS